MSYKEVLPVSLTDSVVEQIKNMIIRQELKNGDKLPSERKLCELLKVSRTVVREATKRLAEIGLIDIQPGRGCYVKRLDHPLNRAMGFLLQSGETTLQNLNEIRQILETQTAALAAEKATGEQIDEMFAILEQFKKADLNEAVELDQKLHIVIANATGNPLFAFVLNTLIDLLRELRTKTLFQRSSREASYRFHKELVESIRNRVAKRARKVMEEHLNYSDVLLRGEHTPERLATLLREE